MFNKNIKKVRGSVLYTVLAVMMIMTVFVVAALTLASSANRRAYNTYANNQTQYTARSIIDTVWEIIINDSEVAGKVSKLNKNSSMDITIDSIDSSMGKVVGDKVTVSCLGIGSEYGYDSPDKFLKLSVTVKMVEQENTIAAYYLSKEIDNFAFKYALVSLDAGYLDNAKIYNGVSVALDVPGSSGMSNVTHLNSPIEINGDYNANLNGKIFIHENQGIFINGKFDMYNNGNIVSVLNSSVLQDNRSYFSLPYMYVSDKIVYGDLQGIGAEESPIIVMAGSLQKGVDVNCPIYGDVYLLDNMNPTIIGGKGITVYPFKNDILKKKHANGSYYTGGNVYSLGEFGCSLRDIINLDLANNVVADTFKIIAENMSPNLRTTGSVVAKNVAFKDSEWGSAINALSFDGGLFVDVNNLVVDTPVNSKSINEVCYDPDNEFREITKSLMYNSESGDHAVSIANPICPMDPMNYTQVIFDTINFSGSLSSIQSLIDSNPDSNITEKSKDVVFGADSFVEIELDKPANLIDDQVAITMFLNGGAIYYNTPYKIEDGKKLKLSLEGKTAMLDGTGNVVLSMNIVPKFDEYYIINNTWDVDYNTVYVSWADSYKASNRPTIENQVKMDWINQYMNANHDVVAQVESDTKKTYSYEWHSQFGYFWGPPPEPDTDEEKGWIEWVWSYLPEDQKKQRMDAALLAKGEELWNASPDKEQLINDALEKACQDAWKERCDNQPKEIKIKSIKVKYNTQIKRTYIERIKNARTFLEWLKLANDKAFVKHGNVIYIDDIDKSVKLEKDGNLMRVSVADLKSIEGDETAADYKDVYEYNYDTEYAEFLKKVVDTATFPESMKIEHSFKSKGGFVDDSFLQKDVTSGKPDIVVKAEKQIDEAFAHIGETAAVTYDASNCPDIIEESCTITGINGTIGSRTITFKPKKDDDIYVKVDGYTDPFTGYKALFLQNTKFIVEDENGGKVHFLVPDGTILSLDQQSAIFNKYFSENNTIKQNPITNNPFYDPSNPDSLEYIADQKMIPGIYIYSDGAGAISCSNKGCISAYILMPEGKMSFSGSGDSNIYYYDGIEVKYIPGGALIGAAICKSMDLSNLCLFAYVNPNPIDDATNKKANYEMSCLYYQAY